MKYSRCWAILSGLCMRALMALAIDYNGCLVIEMSRCGVVALDITSWEGPPLQINSLPDENIYLISTPNTDIALVYNENQRATILLHQMQKRYLCGLDEDADAHITLSTNNAIFYTLNTESCIEQSITALDNQMLQQAVYSIIDA